MNILLINGGQAYAESQGVLNSTLHQVACDLLKQLGHNIKTTVIAEGYNDSEEVDKFMWAQCIIFQMPGWWMGAPWQVKKYMDEVYTVGHGALYENDGRTRSDPNKQYGTGGLLQGRSYMISTTWNAPEAAFTQANNFFEGQGVEAVYFPFHKAHQFLGLKAHPSFLATDVIKTTNIDQTVTAYKNHLMTLFNQKAISYL